MHSGLVFNVQRYSVRDGPGIRTTVFLKGCPLDCWWCHNPESQRTEPELMVLESRCIRCGACKQACPHGLEGICTRCGACVAACPTGARQMIGRQMTVAQVMAEVRKDRIFYDESGGGVTFSGGEPLMQVEFLSELLRACREDGIHSAIDTCGFSPLQQLLAAAELSNLVLYDLKVMDDDKHVQYTGASNARILDNLQALGQSRAVIWIRIPIIPGVNDDEGELDGIARFAGQIRGVQRICLLPYHHIGVQKLARLGRPQRMDTIAPLSPQQMQQIAQRFRSLGLDVTIGR